MGEQYALRVLDSLESGQDAQALANLHNNFAGRLVSSLNVRFHRIQNLIESFITGRPSFVAAVVQVSRCLRILHHADLLDAASFVPCCWPIG